MKPTRARRVVLGLLVAHYANAYMDRMAIAGLAPHIRDEFALSEVGLGAAFSVFSIAYALFQLPWGWLSDRFGARRMLPLMVAFWASFTALTGAAWNTSSLLVGRFLFGVGSAGGFPAATQAMSNWFPPHERGMAQGLTHSGARVGAAIALPLVAWIAAASSWRMAFFVFAAISFVWAAVWHAYYRDRPEDHPGVNDAERQLITPLAAAVGDDNTRTVPWRVLLTSPNMRLLCLMYALVVYANWVYFSWFPTYLVEARGFSFISGAMFGSVPLWIGAIGNTLGGWLTDRLASTRGLRFGRRAVAISGIWTTAFCIVAGVLSANPWTALALLSLAAGALQITVSVSWAVAIDVGPRFSGTVSALMNSCGNLGGALSPLIFGVLVAWTGSWQIPFVVSAAFCMLAGFLWLKIDPERSVLIPHPQP